VQEWGGDVRTRRREVLWQPFQEHQSLPG
jgi:hypothetical protein